MPLLSVVVMCWDCDWWWWLPAEPALLLPLLWLLGAVGLLGLGVAIVVCLNSISSAGLQCRYAESNFSLSSQPPLAAALTGNSGPQNKRYAAVC